MSLINARYIKYPVINKKFRIRIFNLLTLSLGNNLKFNDNRLFFIIEPLFLVPALFINNFFSEKDDGFKSIPEKIKEIRAKKYKKASLYLIPEKIKNTGNTSVVILRDRLILLYIAIY